MKFALPLTWPNGSMDLWREKNRFSSSILSFDVHVLCVNSVRFQWLSVAFSSAFSSAFFFVFDTVCFHPVLRIKVFCFRSPVDSMLGKSTGGSAEEKATKIV